MTHFTDRHSRFTIRKSFSRTVRFVRAVKLFHSSYDRTDVRINKLLCPYFKIKQDSTHRRRTLRIDKVGQRSVNHFHDRTVRMVHFTVRTDRRTVRIVRIDKLFCPVLHTTAPILTHLRGSQSIHCQNFNAYTTHGRIKRNRSKFYARRSFLKLY